MVKQIGKQILSACIVLIGVSFLAFLLSYLSPGDPASSMLSQQGMTPSEALLEQTREEMGLNDPFIIQYKNWLCDVVRLDFGISYKTGENITQAFLKTIPNTMALAVAALIITLVIAIPIGILCARYRDGILDNIIRYVTYLFASLPSFFLSLLALYVFCVRLKLLSVIADTNFRGMIMPALVLGVPLSAWYIRQIRSIAMAQLDCEYIKGLRARGISEIAILWKHVLKNCMIPVITLAGISFGSLLGGAAIVESIFSWNGIGKMAIDAISYRDYPVIQAYAVWMAVIFLLINYLVELLYHYVDPRTRRGGV